MEIKMSVINIEEKLQMPEYDFLRTNVNLGYNIFLLGYGGSHAYGTNNENSDIDIRGIATNSKRNILTGRDFEQVVDVNTDTTIYSFDKIIQLLCSANPNTIEILGLKPEHYFYLSPVGELLLENRHLFLSKRAIHSFGGYANAQLRRLENKSARLVSQSQMEQHILKSIEHASVDFKNRYFEMPDDSIKLYIDKSPREDYDTEIFCDINIKHYPLRDQKGMLNDMGTIIKQYAKIGKRNSKAIEKGKLSKHMCHLIRLYLMAFDILEKGEIITYREKEHDFLMDIRNGKYLDDNRQPIPEFYEIVDEYENKLDKLKDTTDLPDTPDMDKVMDLVENVNFDVVNQEEY
jgi:predicted nucleotidyltransferase